MSAEDVSLYDGMDIAAKCKVARPGTFLDDSLEEEAEPDVSDTISTCLKSCIDGGGEKKRALVDFVEAKAVLPEAFLDDSLEADECDTDTKPTSSAAAVSSTCKLMSVFVCGCGHLPLRVRVFRRSRPRGIRGRAEGTYQPP